MKERFSLMLLRYVISRLLPINVPVILVIHFLELLIRPKPHKEVQNASTFMNVMKLLWKFTHLCAIFDLTLARLLKTNLLQPPADIDTIQARLQCVTELLKNEKLFFDLNAILPHFLDLDHLSTFFFLILNIWCFTKRGFLTSL